MSRADHLRRPLVFHPTAQHTHTVVFLHRFPLESSEYEIYTKVLSAKMSRDHVALRDKFPTIRWVFPYAKQHPSTISSTTTNQPDTNGWKNLSAEDLAALGLESGSGVPPYITQVVLQEAKRVGGLQNVILGGQGETAVAAHEAMRSFTQPEATTLKEPEKLEQLIRQTFHNAEWTKIQDLTLGGFIGMHPENGNLTRDQKEHGLMGRYASATKVNEMIVKNTPHCFIHGGYKTQTITWDGRRIDEVEEFLKEIGIGTNETTTIKQESTGTLGRPTTKSRADPKQGQSQSQSQPGAKNPRAEVDKHLQQVKKQKQADEEARKRVLMRIECDRADREARQRRETERRVASGITRLPANPYLPPEEQPDPEEAEDRRRAREEREKPWMKWPSSTIAEHEARQAQLQAPVKEDDDNIVAPYDDQSSGDDMP